MTLETVDADFITFEPNMGALVNEKGLVRMRFLLDHTPYYSGDIAGFPPDRATELVGAGVAAPCDESGRPVSIGYAEPAPPAPVLRPTIDIPENWEELHHLARVRMAKALQSSDRSLSVEHADEIIRAELERRERTGHG